jgi:hypothetical protein
MVCELDGDSRDNTTSSLVHQCGDVVNLPLPVDSASKYGS